MATFSGWWKAYNKKPTIKPVTWVCGTERVLVEDVVLAIRKGVSPQPWNYLPLSVGEDSERDIWAEVFTLPQGLNQSRLIVVRNAERLKEPERMTAFSKRAGAHPDTYLVMVSNDASVPHQEPDEDQRRRGAKGDVVPYLAALTGKGTVIECRPFTSDTAEIAVAWVQAKTGMRQAVAGHLLNRADGNMRLVRDTCQKLSVLGFEATISAVNDLLAEQPRDTFVDALVAMDKKGALMALERMQPDDYSRSLGLLDFHLDLAGMVHDMTVDHKTPYEIMRRAGNKSFLVKELIPVARHYDPKRRAGVRRVLAVADEALKSGARTGVLESVVALW